MSETKPSLKSADLTGQTVNLKNCPSCDGPHHELPIYEFGVGQSPWTHWYQCPTTLDPVPLCIVDAGGRVHEVNHELVRQLVEAQHRGSYLVAVFRLESGTIKLDRTAVNFPLKDFPEAVKLFSKNLYEESGNVSGTIESEPEVEEMPAVDVPPAPLVNLFGTPPPS